MRGHLASQEWIHPSKMNYLTSCKSYSYWPLPMKITTKFIKFPLVKKFQTGKARVFSRSYLIVKDTWNLMKWTTSQGPRSQSEIGPCCDVFHIEQCEPGEETELVEGHLSPFLTPRPPALGSANDLANLITAFYSSALEGNTAKHWQTNIHICARKPDKTAFKIHKFEVQSL